THAFFKALLFLSSGSVIHALGGEQDVRRMGGLRGKLPTTHLVSLIGVLAISGIPILAGFWSKDAILAAAFTSPLVGDTNILLWIIGLTVTFLTAAYMWRWYLLVFLGSYRGKAHPHESPAVMTLPLWVLAALSAVGGLIGLPHFLPKGWNLLEPLLERATGHPSGFETLSLGAELALIAAAVAAGVGGILAAHLLYQRKGWHYLADVPGRGGEASRRALYLDDAYTTGIGTPSRYAAEGLAYADTNGVDAAAHGVAGTFSDAGTAVRAWESGYLRSYGAAILVSAAALVLYWVVRS
ncbi:MAG TPA: proton-conducting transporter membrane subunit, partial [Deinococcales bacterium]|nr:proton-conducting transporter membrane subunit [Deinococcales bacterium]